MQLLSSQVSLKNRVVVSSHLTHCPENDAAMENSLLVASAMKQVRTVSTTNPCTGGKPNLSHRTTCQLPCSRGDQNSSGNKLA